MEAHNNKAILGGGLYTDTLTISATISRLFLVNNTAAAGGGAYFNQPGSSAIKYSDITDLDVSAGVLMT